MKTKPTSSRRPGALLALAAAALAALTACTVAGPAQDDPTHYYVLTDASFHAGDAATAGTLRLGLRPVTVDAYLRRREIVVRTAGNEVVFKTYRLWAEPLDTAIGRVLRGQLLASPQVAQVYAAPFPGDQDRDFDVAVDVRRCEAEADGTGARTASLAATVEVWTAGPSPRLVARRSFVAAPAAWDGSDYGQLAGLLSADVAALAREIASALPAKAP